MNETTVPFTFSGRIRSMRHAIVGIRDMLTSQHNAWIHAFATGIVVCAGLILGVSPIEWCMLILAIALVWVAEALNTAFELLCDVASPEYHPVVKQCKNIAAGAVLLSAIGSVAIGLVIFVPYLEQFVWPPLSPG